MSKLAIRENWFEDLVDLRRGFDQLFDRLLTGWPAVTEPERSPFALVPPAEVWVDTCLVNKYNLFVLEVLKAWIDPAQKNPKTIHHHGYGKFAVDGEMIKLKSRMR